MDRKLENAMQVYVCVVDAIYGFIKGRRSAGRYRAQRYRSG